MEYISSFLSQVVALAWGPPLIVLLIGGGLYFAWHSRLVPLLGVGHAVALVAGRFRFEGAARGQISHFQALTNALSSTVGLGNIAGVALAIQQGGPGALFWMWVTALIGMNSKFFECTLSVLYRGENYRGEVQGGPMYVIQNALSRKWLPLAYGFALFGLVGTTPMYQVNQVASYLDDQYLVPGFVTGIVFAAFACTVLLGGLKRIAQTTATMVPVMATLYVLAAAVVILLNVERVPGVFASIFSGAFGFESMWGGAVGAGLREVMSVGVKRAAFSNEAGLGTAAMAHSNVRTPEPISEGYVAMLGPLIDTIIVCTMTALVILTTYETPPEQGMTGVLMTAGAFERSLPSVGMHVLSVTILLFGMSTVVGGSNYSNKCWDFVFRGRKGLGQGTFIAVFVGFTFLGSLVELRDVVNLIDTAYALMAVPNILATVLLTPKIVGALRAYRAKYNV